MTITIENFQFDTVIGILEHERSIAQRVAVDLIVEYRHTKGHFLDYVVLRDLIKDEMNKGEFGLIEEALELITERLMDLDDAIDLVDLTIKKPDVLSDCVVGVGKKLFRNQLAMRG